MARRSRAAKSVTEAAYREKEVANGGRVDVDLTES